jgi:hypothetical protein
MAHTAGCLGPFGGASPIPGKKHGDSGTRGRTCTPLDRGIAVVLLPPGLGPRPSPIFGWVFGIGRKDGKGGRLFVVSADTGPSESHPIGESVGDPRGVCEDAQTRGIQDALLSGEIYNGRQSSRLTQEKDRGDYR